MRALLCLIEVSVEKGLQLFESSEVGVQVIRELNL